MPQLPSPRPATSVIVAGGAGSKSHEPSPRSPSPAAAPPAWPEPPACPEPPAVRPAGSTAGWPAEVVVDESRSRFQLTK